MIEPYCWPTPNGHEITLLPRETGHDCVIKPVDIGKDEQAEPQFRQGGGK